jgi:N-acetylneuraminate synthase/sialic acid synthase
MKRIAPIRLKSGLRIGHGQPCFIVAEIGNNHQGDILVAKEMVRSAARVGVQAVKFQKRDMDALFTRAGKEAPYSGPNSFGATYGEHRNSLELGIDEMVELKALAESLGLIFFSSAWDRVSNKEMYDVGVELIKICSADLVNIPLLRQSGAMGLPIILSTGMSTLQDIDMAVRELRRFHQDLILLHCNSSYPCPDEQIGLPVISLLRQRYGLPVGYSGHERGIGPSVAAVALGACVIERHFTLDKTMRGTDHQASLEPQEFETLINMVREVEKASKIRDKQVFPHEAATAKKLRKSIHFSRDLPAGHALSESDLLVKCPGTGLSPVHWDEVLGCRLTRSVRYEEQLDWDALAVERTVLAKGVIPQVR